MVGYIYLRLRHHVLVLALIILSLTYIATASSTPRSPLKRIAHPSTLAIEILPRQPSAKTSLRPRNALSALLDKDSPILYHSDSFRLTLTAFEETFYLHLRPNDHLVHSAARINIYKNAPLSSQQNGLDSQRVLHKTIPLLRESVRAYMGEVVAEGHSHQRMREDAALLRRPRPGTAPGPATSISAHSELGWARIVVHSQGDATRGKPPVFEGAFEVRGVTYHVQTRYNYERQRKPEDPDLEVVGLGSSDPDGQLVIWRSTDLLRHGEATGEMDVQTNALGCSHDKFEFNTDPLTNPVIRKPSKALGKPSWWSDTLMDYYAWPNNTKSKRDDVQTSGSNDFESNIGQTTGCPSTAKVVYMGVAADCEYTASYGSTSNATMQILTNWNTASALYKSTFNVSLGIIELDVQEPECPSTAPSDAPWNIACNDTSVDLNNRLSLFSGWRGQKGSDGTGLWHLMSGCPSGTEVGVAWLGTLCQQTSSGQAGSFVSGTAVSTNGLTEWEVVSHEIGHNFGAIHDCQSGCNSTGSNSPVCCPMSSGSCNANDQFIMSPVTQSSQKIFSQCSLGNICSVMQSTSSSAVNTSCIVDPDSSVKTLSLNMCGNGIVESGEQCDPGTNSTSSCCDATTCQFKSEAVCDPTNDACCTDTCQFASAQTVCRPAVDASCDIAEMCTGSSGACPADKFQSNGQSCGSNGLTCADGVCTSLNQQCATVGASLNLTTACSKQDTSCQVSCQDPNNANQCVQLQAQVIDGSSCGLGGTCQSGACVSGSALDTAKAWYVQNLQISIPVTVVVGIVVIFLLVGLFLCIKRCRSKPPSMDPAFVRNGGTRLGSYEGPESMRPAGVLPPPVPFVSRPAPTDAQSHSRQGSQNSSRSMADVSGRRTSLPRSLKPGSISSGMDGRGHAPPGSPRSQSWDSIGGGGAARGPSRSPPNAGERARTAAFPRPDLARVQERPRARDESAWVDPRKWNGPA